MKTKISQDIYDEIAYLVERALAAGSKAEADSYISRLDFLHRSGGYEGYANIVFGQLVASVKRASGKVSDKERLCSFARADLFKLSGQIGDENGGS